MSKGFVEVGGMLYGAELSLGPIEELGPVPCGQATVHEIKCYCGRCKAVCENRTIHNHFMYPYCEDCKKKLNSILRSQ